MPPGFRPPASQFGLILPVETRERRALLALPGHRAHLISPQSQPPPHTVTRGHSFNRGVLRGHNIQSLKTLHQSLDGCSCPQLGLLRSLLPALPPSARCHASRTPGETKASVATCSVLDCSTDAPSFPARSQGKAQPTRQGLQRRAPWRCHTRGSSEGKQWWGVSSIRCTTHATENCHNTARAALIVTDSDNYRPPPSQHQNKPFSAPHSATPVHGRGREIPFG